MSDRRTKAELVSQVERMERFASMYDTALTRVLTGRTVNLPCNPDENGDQAHVIVCYPPCAGASEGSYQVIVECAGNVCTYSGEKLQAVLDTEGRIPHNPRFEALCKAQTFINTHMLGDDTWRKELP